MVKERTDATYYIGCMTGAALGNAMGNCCRKENAPAGFTNTLHFGGLMQLAVFTAEGLLRATHRAKMHGSNGTFSELVYESYLRWLKTQQADYNDLVNVPSKDGWLICRSEMYYKGFPLKHTLDALRRRKSGEVAGCINDYDDAEGMLRVFPTGLMFPGEEQLAFQLGYEICEITHGSKVACLCAAFYAALVSRLAEGDEYPQAIECSLSLLAPYGDDARCVMDAVRDALYFIDDLKAAESGHEEEEIRNFTGLTNGSDKASDVLMAGLVSALAFQNDYRRAVLSASGYKGAPHTAAMLAGSLAGLTGGETAIPREWLDNLSHKEIVIQIAKDLYTGIKGGIFIIDREWLKKYPGW